MKNQKNNIFHKTVLFGKGMYNVHLKFFYFTHKKANIILTNFDLRLQQK